MKAIYEIGDKFYESDYSYEVFLEIQKNLTNLCMQKNSCVTVEEGRDKKGYYLILAKNNLSDNESKPLYSMQCDKKDDLDYSFEFAINHSVFLNNAFYDCDNLSVLRITMILKASNVCSDVLPDYWIDQNNNIHTDNIRNLLLSILVEYYRRNCELDKKYNEILQNVYDCDSKEELEMISFEELKRVK